MYILRNIHSVIENYKCRLVASIVIPYSYSAVSFFFFVANALIYDVLFFNHVVEILKSSTTGMTLVK